MRLTLILVSAAVALVSIPVVAKESSEAPVVKLSKGTSWGMKDKKVAVLSYGINFVTAQKASANASIGTKARGAATLGGVDEATMRQLANEALADLQAQLTAAGIPVVDNAAVAEIARSAGISLLPGNKDVNRDGGITIGSGVKKAYTSVGADGAPLTDLYVSGGQGGAFAAFGKIGKSGKLNGPSAEKGIIFSSPSLTIDFADADAKTTRTLAGSKRASVEIETQFAIRVPSPVNFQVGAKAGLGTPSTMFLAKDVVFEGSFTSSSGVSSTSTAGDYGQWNPAESGVVQVDRDRWTSLVRTAFKAYNASITANLVAARR